MRLKSNFPQKKQQTLVLHFEEPTATQQDKLLQCSVHLSDWITSSNTPNPWTWCLVSRCATHRRWHRIVLSVSKLSLQQKLLIVKLVSLLVFDLSNSPWVRIWKSLLETDNFFSFFFPALPSEYEILVGNLQQYHWFLVYRMRIWFAILWLEFVFVFHWWMQTVLYWWENISISGICFRWNLFSLVLHLNVAFAVWLVLNVLHQLQLEMWWFG